MSLLKKLQEVFARCVGGGQLRKDNALDHLKQDARESLDGYPVRYEDIGGAHPENVLSELFIEDIKNFVSKMKAAGFVSGTGINRRIENQELSDLFVRMMERFADYTEKSNMSEKSLQRHLGDDVWRLRTHDNQRSGGSVLIAHYAEQFLSKAQYLSKVNIAEGLPALKLAA